MMLDTLHQTRLEDIGLFQLHTAGVEGGKKLVEVHAGGHDVVDPRHPIEKVMANPLEGFAPSSAKSLSSLSDAVLRAAQRCFR